MQYSLILIATVLAQQARFCAGLEAVREVTINSAGALDLQQEHQPPYEAYWRTARSRLLEQQFRRTSSKASVDTRQEELSISASIWSYGWTEVLDGTWLKELSAQCERDPVIKAGVTQNLSAMQAFVAFVSIGYAIIAMWLGPIKLSCWQRRSVLVTYSTAGSVQAIFIMHAFGFIGVHYAYPSTLALVLVFFVTFNLTNALLVLEPDEHVVAVPVPAQHIVEASSTRVITAQRAACF